MWGGRREREEKKCCVHLQLLVGDQGDQSGKRFHFLTPLSEQTHHVNSSRGYSAAQLGVCVCVCMELFVQPRFTGNVLVSLPLLEWSQWACPTSTPLCVVACGKWKQL